MRINFKFVLYLIVLMVTLVAKAGVYDDLFVAVIRDDVGRLRSLLEQGVDPNSRDPKGYPVLSVALRRESPKAFALLLAHPAIDVNALNATGESPLMLAAIAGDLESCEQLLARGAQVQKAGWTPLHYAAGGQNTRIVELLLARGAGLDAESPNGTTPLMLAAQTAPESTVELLLRRGADPKRRNQRELQAVDFARLGGRDWLVDRLEPLSH
jgi:ankyrin repeat protein